MEKDKQNSVFINEIAKLKTELSSSKAENEKLKQTISDLSEKMRIIDEEGNRKEHEQEETFKLIHSKIKLLNAYFSGLENRLKKAEE